MKTSPLAFLLTFLLTLLPFHACVFASDTGGKPNIIIIMADDLGFGDVSCNGATAIATPHIDALAARGLRFTAGYTSASTCTPTRFSFLTGNYAFRTKGTGVAPPNGPALIPAGTETLASILQRAGYATAVVGKWHLGLGSPAPDWNNNLKPGPLDIGFDHCLLLPTTNDRVPQVFVEDRRVKNLDPADPLWVGDAKPSPDHPTGITHRDSLKIDWLVGHNGTIHNGISRIGFYTGGVKARFRDEDLADEWVNHSIKWIEAHRKKDKTKPFFLFLASHDIHVPRIPHERFQGKSKLGPRGDSILSFDWTVGEITKAVDKMGIAENTLIILCSDNGPVLNDGYKDQSAEKNGDHKPAGPYRGGKYSVFEGGTRTPFIAAWKGRITPGVSDEAITTLDLPATLGALAGEKPKPDTCRDSLNLLPALLGEKNAKGRDHVIQQDNLGNNLGLRAGQWKLIRQKIAANAKNKEEPPAGLKPGFRYQLYDLSKDTAETTDLAAKEPAQLKRMHDLLEDAIEGRPRRATN